MNPRVVAIIAGAITTAFGLIGLLYPDRVMGMLGFSILNTANAAAVLGEVRATYGGLFVVLGVYTLFIGLDPAARRSGLMFIGLLWLGVCAGRLLGVNINGNPGLPGWGAAVLELLMGSALVAASVMARPAQAALPRVSPAVQPTPTPIAQSSGTPPGGN